MINKMSYNHLTPNASIYWRLFRCHLPPVSTRRVTRSCQFLSRSDRGGVWRASAATIVWTSRVATRQNNRRCSHVGGGMAEATLPEGAQEGVITLRPAGDLLPFHHWESADPCCVSVGLRLHRDKRRLQRLSNTAQKKSLAAFWPSYHLYRSSSYKDH